MRCRLRTLLIVLAVGPPVLSAGHILVQEYYAQDDIDAYRKPILGIVIDSYEPATEGPGFISVPVDDGNSISVDEIRQRLPSP